MNANPISHGIENTFDHSGGSLWNRLHAEREEICAAMVDESAQNVASVKVIWPRDLLQYRLRRIDDALDRLFSGSYGHCSKCGKQIDEIKLGIDPAAAFCKGCANADDRAVSVGYHSPSELETEYPGRPYM